MSHLLHVYALPQYAGPDELAGGVAVMIDVLRASTTIVAALEAGAAEILPCEEIDEARRQASDLPAGEVLLGGERGGLPIDGFDLGNSPEEYQPGVVGSKRIVFTTTNGTRALARCRAAARVLVGAFVNASALYERLVGEQAIHLVCAGTAGEVGRDDVLFAGLLVDRLQRRSGLPYALNAQAITARENWLSAFSLPAALGGEPLDPGRLADELRNSPGGRNLTAIGQEADILAAAQIDRYSTVPELDRDSFRVRLPSP